MGRAYFWLYQEGYACVRLPQTTKEHRLSNSEIAHLRAQIELACEAAKRSMTEFAVTASHEAINARMEKLGGQIQDYQQQLASLVGEQQALRVVAETYQTIVG